MNTKGNADKSSPGRTRHLLHRSRCFAILIFILSSATMQAQDPDTVRQLSRDSIVVQQTYSDAFGRNNLQVKVINPCSADFFDGPLTQIEARLTNKTKTTGITYRHPDAAMSLILFVKDEIHLKDFNGKKAVFIPFYYCGGYEDYDRKVSYLVLYNNREYIFHMDYRCQGAHDCKPVKDLAVLVGELPLAIRPYFLSYVTGRHQSRDSFHQD